VNVLVDTSVWSLALRRDQPPRAPQVEALHTAIDRGDVCLTGVILQEVLQGFPSEARTRRLVEHLAPFPLIGLDREDFVFAAHIRNTCRRKGVAIATVDAQIASAAINHGCVLLTADSDFEQIARHFPLRLRSG
jgi:predicted nucleic acid-binding protein